MIRRLNWKVRTAVTLAVVVFAVFVWQTVGNSQSASAPAQLGLKPAVMMWTKLASNTDVVVSASKVPGGWFVYIAHRGTNPANTGPIGGAFFYPDPLHEWDGASL
jgi:hypothetical protein